MPAATLQLTVPASVAAIPVASERMAAACAALSALDASLFETVLSEVMTNIIKHSLAGSGATRFQVALLRTSRGIELLFEDAGRGMPVEEFSRRPATLDFDPADLSTVPESGMGIALIKSLMDDVEYSREQGVNRLRLFKRC